MATESLWPTLKIPILNSPENEGLNELNFQLTCYVHNYFGTNSSLSLILVIEKFLRDNVAIVTLLNLILHMVIKGIHFVLNAIQIWVITWLQHFQDTETLSILFLQELSLEGKEPESIGTWRRPFCLISHYRGKARTRIQVSHYFDLENHLLPHPPTPGTYPNMSKPKRIIKDHNGFIFKPN